MDLTPPDALRPEAGQRIGWPVPWWGLASGAGFVALMATPLGAMPGFIMIWVVIIAGAPFMIAASLIGGEAAGYVAGALALAIYVLAPVGFAVRAILRRPTAPPGPGG